MPYGDCVLANEILPDDYIYRNYKYEPEVLIIINNINKNKKLLFRVVIKVVIKIK